MQLKKLMRGATLAGSLVLASALYAQSGCGITVDVNGQAVAISSGSARMIGGRVMVPLRGVLESLGANVDWDQNAQQITINKGSTDVVMHIGDSNAKVNGQDQPLDQPAVLMGGTTLVPLRFLSETFGATVNWDASNRTVDIDMADAMNTQTVNTTDTLQANSQIQTTAPLKLADNVNGWLAGGQAVQFTLTGSPGGKAALVMPGISGDIPMTESQPGTYTATWTPSATSPVTVIAATAMAKLTLGDKTYYSPGVTNLNVDMTPPVISAAFPVDNAVISGFKPEMKVHFVDDASGIDPAKIHMTFNGQDVTGSCKITDSNLTYDLPNDLSPGQYSVAFSVGDKAGNVASKKWNFSVIGNSITSNFIHTGTGTLAPGNHVHFSLSAAPGCQVTVTLGNGDTAPLSETSPGVYTGDYTVQPYDRFGGDIVTATIVPPNGGQTYTIESPQMMGVSGNISMKAFIPIIASPLASQAIANPLVIAGSAPPGSTVLIQVHYKTVIGPHADVSGQLADVAVVADRGGNFTTPKLHIEGLDDMSHTVFHITARTVLPDGTQSDMAVLDSRPLH
ncbi:MAG TPA: stalk domain-containing protein [Fimbriimonadaceae bacterium]|jgi:hypothetical protein